MRTPDYAHRMTDAELARLEQKIARVYARARDELSDTVNEYFTAFQKRDEEMKRAVTEGKITAQHYKQWRLNQIARGKHFEALRDKMAERYTNANEVAISYANDVTPGIYSLNRNYAAYTIDRATGGALTIRPDGETLNADFILFDEQTVKRLISEEPDVMPYYPPERAVARGIDLAYGKSQITKNVTSGILRGLSVKQMADNLQERMETMNRTSALRAARTTVTAAQNAGRMDSYHAAQNMGIRLKKQWLATLDGRTRHSHQMVDGEAREIDAKFSNGCLYPGDPSGAAHEIYNCRCTLITDLPENLSAGQRRARDPVTGESVVIDFTTYPNWAGSFKFSAKSGNEPLANRDTSDIILKTELFRKKDDARAGFRFISDKTFDNLTIAARKKGAIIIRGGKDIEKHLDSLDASAATLGNILLFKRDVCISEVLEETHHFEQNLAGMNDDKGEPLRTILNEIDAKQFILDNAKKYRVPRKEIELIRRQLASYEDQLKKYGESD